jgi:hypothetical protein
LLKTFHTSVGGWADVQLSDGTVGLDITDRQDVHHQPGSRQFFRPLTPRPPTCPGWRITNLTNGGLMTPKRRRTPAAEAKARLTAEHARSLMSPPF